MVRGTADCHDGDRPWLAGGKANQVYLATDTVEGSMSGHQVFVSNDGGNTCSATGIDDNGSLPDGGVSGFGKLYYDKLNGAIVEPAVFNHGDGSFGVGISTMLAGGSSFTPHQAAGGTSMYAHWPAIAIDAAGTIYSGVGHRSAPVRHERRVQCVGHTCTERDHARVHEEDLGKTWSTPVAIAQPANARVFWPWITAGDAGKVSVVWYQTEPQDGMPDLDCRQATCMRWRRRF